MSRFEAEVDIVVATAVTHGHPRARGGRIGRFGRRTAILVLAWSLLVVLASPAGTSQAEPSAPPACAEDQRSIRFYDVDPASAHAASIDCLANWNLSLGLTGHRFGPNEQVSRGQLASFLLRTLDNAGMRFDDEAVLADAGAAGVHGEAARQLVAAGVLRAEDGTFDPEAPLRRDAMAVGLVAAYERAISETVPTPSGRPFNDLGGHPDADTIAKAVALGLVRGTSDGTYEPAGTVTRGQMASFLTRLLDALVAADLATRPTDPDWAPDVELAITLSEAAEARTLPDDLQPPLEVAGQTLTRLYDDVCVTYTATSPACVYGDTEASRSLVMYGDSHMAHWFPAIEELAIRHGWRVRVLTKGGCPAWEVDVRGDDGFRDYDCVSWRTHALQRIAAEPPEMILISGASHYEAYDPNGRPTPQLRNENLLDGQAAALESVRAAAPDARLVVFGASGRARFDAVGCLSANPDDLQNCTPRRGEVVDDALIDAQRRLASAAGAAFVDTSRWLCTDAACPPIIDGRLVRWDAHHLSPAVTGWLAPMIEPIVFGSAG